MPTYNTVSINGINLVGSGQGESVTVTLTPQSPYFDTVSNTELNLPVLTAVSDVNGAWSVTGIPDPTPAGSGLAWNLTVVDRVSGQVLYNQGVQIAYSSGSSQHWLSLSPPPPPANVAAFMLAPAASGVPIAGSLPVADGAGGSAWGFLSKSAVTATGLVYAGGAPAFSLVGYANGVTALSSPVTNNFGHAAIDTGNASVVVVSGPAAAAVSVSDPYNSYAQVATVNTTSDFLYVFACFGARSVTPQQVKVTQSVNQKMNIALFNAPGLTGVDVTSTASGSSAAPSVASAAQNLTGDFEVALFSNPVAYTNATPAGWSATPNLGVGPYSNGFTRTSTGLAGDTCTSSYAASQSWCAVSIAFRTALVQPDANVAVPGSTGYVSDSGHQHPSTVAWLNVRNFGAKGDGATDDTAAIQRALDKAGSGTGNTVVYLPTGNYVVSGPLSYPYKHALTIQGDGINGWNNGTVIWWKPGSSPYNIFDIGGGAVNTSSVNIYDLQITTFSVNSTPAAGYVGINCNTVGNVTVKRVMITQSFTGGFAPPTTGIKCISCGGSNIVDCPAVNGYGDAVWMNAGKIMYIANTGLGTVLGSGGAGIRMDGGAQSLYAINSGVQGNGDRGIYVPDGGLIALENFSINPVSVCAVELVAGSGFWAHQLWTSHSGGGNTPLIHGFVIGSGFLGGVYLSDCTFQDWTGHGMLVNGGKGIIVRGCSFGINGSFTGAPHTYDDIHLGGSATNITIAGNHFNSDPFMGQSANGVRSSVYLESGVSNVIISDNLFTNSGGGYGAAPVVNVGASNVQVRDNLGYNPVGKLSSPPAVGSSGAVVTNATGLDATVYVTCGSGVSVSVISIGGNATGQTVSASTTSAGIRVPANSSVALTYAGGTPTWTWFAD